LSTIAYSAVMDGSSASQWCAPQSMQSSASWSESELLSFPHSPQSQRNGSVPAAVSTNRMTVRVSTFIFVAPMFSSLF
jgi:hypothetical protein